MESLFELIIAIVVAFCGLLLGRVSNSIKKAMIYNSYGHSVIRITPAIGKDILLVNGLLGYIPVEEYLLKNFSDKKQQEKELALIKKAS